MAGFATPRFPEANAENWRYLVAWLNNLPAREVEDSRYAGGAYTELVSPDGGSGFQVAYDEANNVTRLHFHEWNDWLEYDNDGEAWAFSHNGADRLKIGSADITTDVNGPSDRSIAGNAGTHIQRSSNGTLPSSTWVFLINANAVRDDDNWHNVTGTNSERITVDKDGWYAFHAQAVVTGGSPSRFIISVGQRSSPGRDLQGGNQEWDFTTGASTYATLSGLAYKSAGDYFTMNMWSNITVDYHASRTFLRVARLF